MITRLLHRCARQFSLPPEVVCFGFVGCMGLATDMSSFTALHEAGMHPLAARIFSLAFATLMTWSLNRHLTFERRERSVGNEASRYVMVTLCAQGLSYGTFAILVLLMPQFWPQVFMVIGAIAGAAFSFLGHKLFSFAPTTQRI